MPIEDSLLQTQNENSNENNNEFITNQNRVRNSAANIIAHAFLRDMRKKDHFRIFNQAPTRETNLPKCLSSNIPGNAKIIKVIHNLTRNLGVIRYLDHYTTLKNLQSILASKRLYGAQSLKGRKYEYDENSLTSLDIKNGDGDVICFTPSLVDSAAYQDKKTNRIKDNAMIISVDLQKNYFFNKINPYAQFIKLYDLNSPSVDLLIEFTDKLFVYFEKKCNSDLMNVTITCDESSAFLYIYREDTIFYGDPLAINRFCLLNFFKLLDCANDQELTDKIIAYLNELSEKEIEKFLVTFSKGLTLNAEYNFLHSVQLPRLEEIHYIKDQYSFDLSEIKSPEKYKKVIEDIKTVGDTTRIPRKNSIKIKNISSLLISVHGFLFRQRFMDILDTTQEEFLSKLPYK